MKKWAIPILIVAIILTGCAVRPAATQTPPLAYIDSVSPSEVYVGEEITFVGHGVSTSGEIVAYNWRSSINGDLSTLATFETDMLSAGSHTIWFKVQDSYGNWSSEVGTNVKVLLPGGITRMVIRNFTASPPAIKEGEYAMLIWEVDGSGKVRIEPDIGDVGLSGSRTVRPLVDTIYTIIATNDQGVITATTKVAVSALPLNTVATYSIAGEDGTVRKDKVVLDEVLVGENEAQVQMQGFLSFDISAIPPDAVIKGVELDLSSAAIIGSPFPFQGSLCMYNYQYGNRLRASDYCNYNPPGQLFTWNYGTVSGPMTILPFTSAGLVTALQNQVDARSTRFQLRLQFEKYFYYTRKEYSASQVYKDMTTANCIDIGSGKAKLTVHYYVPE